jgi:hypothetical protein
MKLYVYALVDRALPSVHLRGHAIETFPVGDLHAAAERAEQAPAITEQSLCEQHDIVVDLATRVPAILPARFGALVDRDELEAIVSRRHAQLTTALALVREREQMTVRLIGDDSETRSRRPSLAAGAGPGARYLDARRAAAGYPLPDAVERLHAAVGTMIVAARAEPGQGAVRAMIYHLIERGSSSRYCRALVEASGDVAPFVVKVSGPFPPFAFAPEMLA